MERSGYILHYLMFPQHYGTDTDGFRELFEHHPSLRPHDVGGQVSSSVPSGQYPGNAVGAARVVDWLQSGAYLHRLRLVAPSGGGATTSV